MMKIAGAPPTTYEHLDHESFLQQARDFEALDEDSFDRFAEVVSVMYAQHPWTVMRASELEQWYISGDRTSANAFWAAMLYQGPRDSPPWLGQ